MDFPSAAHTRSAHNPGNIVDFPTAQRASPHAYHGSGVRKPCTNGDLQDKLKIASVLRFKKVPSEEVPDDGWALEVEYQKRKIIVRDARLFGHQPIVIGMTRTEIDPLLSSILAEHGVTEEDIERFCITEDQVIAARDALRQLVNGYTDILTVGGVTLDPLGFKSRIAPDDWMTLNTKLVTHDDLSCDAHPDVVKTILEFNKRYAIVDADGEVLVFDRKTRSKYSYAEFKKHRIESLEYREKDANGDYRRKKKKKAELWFESPGRTTHVGRGLYPLSRNSDGQDYRECSGTLLQHNTWQGWGVEAREGAYPKFQTHMRDIVCRGNEQHCEYLNNWFAHRVQKPWQKPRVAPVVWGQKQTGKSLVADMFRRIAGVHGTIVEKEGHITNRFANLTNYVFCQVEEALYSGDPRLANITKHALTSATQRIEEKHGDEFDKPSYTGFFFTSNAERAVATTSDEERFFVLQASAEHKGDKPYFDAILAEMKQQGGCEAWLYDLQRRDISKFAPWDLPFTTAFGEMVIANLQGLEKAIVDAVREGCITINGVGGVIERQIPWLNKPFDVEADHLWQAFGKAAREYGEDHGSRVKIGATFSSLGLVARKIETDNSRGIKASYTLLPLDAARAVLAKRYNVGMDLLGHVARSESDAESVRRECLAELDALSTRLGLPLNDPHRLAMKKLIDGRYGR